MTKLPWEWVQSFITVAEQGSLSKAASELGTSQPTLSRQMAALEQRIEMTLFDRSTQGLKLTDAGSKLIESSEEMKRAAEQFNRTATGAITSIEGSIRISANEIIGLYYLPEIISEFHQLYPQVQVEIEISNSEISLNKRDADIALRMFRPTQLDLIAKRLPDIGLSFVASKEYLKKHSEPKSMDDINGHRLIGYDRAMQFKQAIKELGWPLTDKDFCNKTDFLPLHIELSRRGVGITATHNYLLERFTDLKVILEDVYIPSLEFWIVCHADVQHNRRIRIMMDFLTNSFQTKLNQ